MNIRNEYTGTFASHSRSQRLRGAARVFTVTKKARPKQSFDMNLKAWDNNEAAYGVPFRLLLVLNLCGRLWIRMTSGSGFPSPHLRFFSASAVSCGLRDPGMKEGCSGENVLERER